MEFFVSAIGDSGTPLETAEAPERWRAEGGEAVFSARGNAGSVYAQTRSLNSSKKSLDSRLLIM